MFGPVDSDYICIIRRLGSPLAGRRPKGIAGVIVRGFVGPLLVVVPTSENEMRTHEVIDKHQ